MNNDSINSSEEELLKNIRSGDRVILRKVYNQYRPAFGTWVSKYYGCDQDMAAEIYQRAFITLYYNVKDGKLTDLTSSIKTYLFAIGRNLMRDHYKLTTRRKEIMEVVVDKGAIDNQVLERYEQSDMKETVKDLLQQIGEPCKTVLDLFYLRGYALEAIASEMNYKSEQIAAKRKFICLKQMRQMLSTAQKRREL